MDKWHDPKYAYHHYGWDWQYEPGIDGEPFLNLHPVGMGLKCDWNFDQDLDACHAATSSISPPPPLPPPDPLP